MKKIKLDNGLTVILNSDKSKKAFYVELTIKYGAIVKDYLYKNKEYYVIDGTAHLLEHLLIEHSPYGNIEYFLGNKQLYVNGGTDTKKTSYYISGSTNLNFGIEVLLKSINTLNVNDEILAETKKAIFEEIRIAKDNNGKKLFKTVKNSLFWNYDYNSTLGTNKELKSITCNDLQNVFNAFYNLENEILTICGGFDEDEVINIINKICGNLPNKKYQTKIIVKDEPINVKYKNKIIKTNIGNPTVSINYKIKYNCFTSLDKYKLEWYINFFFANCYGNWSNLNDELFNKKIINKQIITFYTIFNDYINITIQASTNNEKEFIKRIINNQNNYILNEDLFEKSKKDLFLDFVTRQENPKSTALCYLDNILLFNYDYIDSIDFINSLSFEEFNEYIKKLDFSNYSIVKMIDNKF